MSVIKQFIHFLGEFFFEITIILIAVVGTIISLLPAVCVAIENVGSKWPADETYAVIAFVFINLFMVFSLTKLAFETIDN